MRDCIPIEVFSDGGTGRRTDPVVPSGYTGNTGKEGFDSCTAAPCDDTFGPVEVFFEGYTFYGPGMWPDPATRDFVLGEAGDPVPWHGHSTRADGSLGEEQDVLRLVERSVWGEVYPETIPPAAIVLRPKSSAIVVFPRYGIPRIPKPGVAEIAVFDDQGLGPSGLEPLGPVISVVVPVPADEQVIWADG